MLTRRELLKRAGQGAAVALCPGLPRGLAEDAGGVELNDVQSQLNPTRVNRVVAPEAIADIQTALRAAQRENRAVSIAGGRHAMGGQQFGTDALHFDMQKFNRVLAFDRGAGTVDVVNVLANPTSWTVMTDAITGLSTPLGFTFVHDDMYIAELGNNRVLRYDLVGTSWVGLPSPGNTGATFALVTGVQDVAFIPEPSIASVVLVGVAGIFMRRRTR